MNKTIEPFIYSGEIISNTSKSYFQRAIAIIAVSKSTCQVYGSYDEDDVKVALSIFKSIGGEIKKDKNSIFLDSRNVVAAQSISVFCGESGLSTRMFGTVLTSLFLTTKLNGDKSIINREIDFSELSQLGVIVENKSKNLPIVLNGKLNYGTIDINGSDGSQLISGLLIALFSLNGDSIVNVKDLVSKPYILMTISILKAFGISVVNEEFSKFIVKGNQIPKKKEYHVEGDWSGAAFHLVGAAISGEVTIKGLNLDSLQADIAILNALIICGAQIAKEKNCITVKKDRLESFVFDATNCPDLFPSLVVLASCCNGRTKISGVSRLSNKESNRAIVLQLEFKKLGVEIEIIDNDMFILGAKKITGNKVNSHGDHRIAMALAIMASISESSIIIENSEVVAKSYTKFYSDLEKVIS